jgi:DDE_Tnp_1-associated
MDAVTEDCGAFSEAVVFLNHFRDLPDLRQSGQVMYPLDKVLLLALLAVLAGADSFVDIARFGRMNLAYLRRFRPFLGGTPLHDHLGDILAALDAEQSQRCFVAWVASLIGAPAGAVALGPVKVAEKSNEIVAIPKLLNMPVLEGAISTIDPMGCQRAIAKKIIDKKADYVFGLKGK